MDDRGVERLLRLLAEGHKGPHAKAEALEAVADGRLWLATWEPRAEGFRTLINGSGEEALAVFTSESALSEAARRFGWLEADGNVATHESLGSDILRHAWTREYAFLVVDIAASHSVEFDREELRVALRELDRTGPFRTSRPPAPSEKAAATSSSFPPPVEKISTMYSMAPSHAERLDRLSDLPTKPHELPSRTQPPRQRRPRTSAKEVDPATGNRPSSRPAAKPDSNPPAKIEEVIPESAKVDVGGTYGAASIVPPNPRRALTPSRDADPAPESTHPVSEASPSLQSDAPTAPAVRASDFAPGGKLALPPAPQIGMTAAEPAPPSEQPATTEESVNRPSRLAAPSIGDSIELAPLQSAPADALLDALNVVLRRYPEIEWASYCQVSRPAGEPSPAVGLRVMDTYRDNITVIIKELCEAGRKQDVELDVLLVDGHDLLRKAREAGFVFFPWKPKPFGG